MATAKTRRYITVLFKRSRPKRGLYIDVRFLPGRVRKPAVMVATSVSRLAVVRNRSRRVIEAALHTAVIPEGQLLVVVRKSLVNQTESQAARDELHRLLPPLP